MARRRLIIHGSQEEPEMFEPFYNTRLRLQHGAAPSRFHIPDPPTASVESEREVEDEGAVGNVPPADQERNEAVAESTACCSSDNEEENDSLPDIPRSTTLVDDEVGFADNGNTGGGLCSRLHGNGSEAPAYASRDSDTDSDSDS